MSVEAVLRQRPVVARQVRRRGREEGGVWDLSLQRLSGTDWS